MKNYKRPILLVSLLLVLLLFNRSVWQKEATLKNGTLVLIPLAPVDPRSLMQGDFMRLNYNLGERPSVTRLANRGYAIVRLNDSNIAHIVRYQPALQPLHDGERPVRYFLGNRGSIRIGAESYFFEEGTAEKYDSAKYGALKVDDKGNSVLHGLYNAQLQLIK